MRGRAIALEDSDVCAMPYSLIEEIGRGVPSLQRRLHSVLAGEIVFLGRGCSGSSFVLRMTREEIGSYLGLKLETVSRLFSAFHKEGLSDVQKQAGRRLQSILILRRVALSGFGSVSSSTPSASVAFAFDSSTSAGSASVREKAPCGISAR